MSDLPEYYFRVRETGATVFRVTAGTRQRRIEMDQIAAVNLRTSQIRPHGDRALTEEDMRAIRDWMRDRAELVEARRLDDVMRTVDRLNHTAHWAATEAGDAELGIVTEPLMMAMHDLRTVLVRKKADRAARAARRDG